MTKLPDWSDLVYDYAKTWLKMNAPFYHLALDKLPELKKESVLGVPGAGNGYELEMLLNKFDKISIKASDPYAGMVKEAEENIKALNNPSVEIQQLGFEDLERDQYNAAISFFAVHVSKKPLQSIVNQFNSVKEGGWSCTVYFPPIPEKGGPLDGLFTSMRKLKPKTLPEWENNLEKDLLSNGAEKVEIFTLNSEWKFSCRFDFRRAMECLPTFLAVKKHTDEQFYRNLWAVWSNNHGLEQRDGGWVGPVAARMVVAYK